MLLVQPRPERRVQKLVRSSPGRSVGQTTRLPTTTNGNTVHADQSSIPSSFPVRRCLNPITPGRAGPGADSGAGHLCLLAAADVTEALGAERLAAAGVDTDQAAPACPPALVALCTRLVHAIRLGSFGDHKRSAMRIISGPCRDRTYDLGINSPDAGGVPVFQDCGARRQPMTTVRA